MRWRKVTVGTLIGLGFLLAAFDSFLAMNDEDDDTISEVVDDAVHKQPWIAFAVGFIHGHLMWPQRKRET